MTCVRHVLSRMTENPIAVRRIAILSDRRRVDDLLTLIDDGLYCDFA
jgi:hypothetical protein